MAIIRNRATWPATRESDPDDYRPRSTWAFVVDPSDAERPFVTSLALSIDNIAPGDRVPLHTHPIDEALASAFREVWGGCAPSYARSPLKQGECGCLEDLELAVSVARR